MRVSVVLPVHNEAADGGATLTRLAGEIAATLSNASNAPWECIFVDDGSTDDTPRVLAAIAERDARFRVVTLRRNFGQTAALAAGFDAARGERIVTLDADGQNDPSAVPALLAKLSEGYDAVSGVRSDRKDPLNRRLVSRIANVLISRATGVPIRDAGCSLKAYRREVLKDVRLYGEMHRFLPALVAWAGGRVTEMEVPHRPRRSGRSHYSTLGRTWKVVLDLLVVKFLFSYETKPIHLFGGLGLLSLAASGGVGAFVVYRRVVLGGDWLSPLFFVGALLFAFGVQFLLMGLLADLLVRTYHESQGKPIYRVAAQIDRSGHASHNAST